MPQCIWRRTHRREHSGVHARGMDPHRTRADALTRTRHHDWHDRDIEVFRQHERPRTIAMDRAITAAASFGKDEDANAGIRQRQRRAFLVILRRQCIAVGETGGLGYL